jgi:hypothetical protein
MAVKLMQSTPAISAAYAMPGRVCAWAETDPGAASSPVAKMRFSSDQIHKGAYASVTAGAF